MQMVMAPLTMGKTKTTITMLIAHTRMPQTTQEAETTTVFMANSINNNRMPIPTDIPTPMDMEIVCTAG